MKIRKRAFTLTELLVVVIVIGVLAAVVLPKFSKIMETRKTTEAEEVMSAIRAEQEHRCALDKPYYGDINDLAEILPNNDTKHYTYSLDTVGMMASSKGTYSYTLKMPSYLDGRICCEGAECDKLNKDYPTCTDLTQEADYEEETNCAAALVLPPTPDIPCVPDGDGGASRSCGCSGTQTRTCDTSTGTWGPWSNCSRPSPECTPGSDGTTFVPGFSDPVCQDGCWVERGSVVSNPCPSDLDGQATSKSCGCNNQGTQTRSCNPVTGMWSVWSQCSVAETCECNSNVTESCTVAGYEPVNCGTRTHYCENGLWKTGENAYSACQTTSNCCTASTRPLHGCWYCSEYASAAVVSTLPEQEEENGWQFSFYYTTDVCNSCVHLNGRRATPGDFSNCLQVAMAGYTNTCVNGQWVASYGECYQLYPFFCPPRSCY